MEEEIKLLAADCDFLCKEAGKDFRGFAGVRYYHGADRPWRISMCFYLDECDHTDRYETFDLALAAARKMIATRADHQLTEPKHEKRHQEKLEERSGRLREIIGKARVF